MHAKEHFISRCSDSKWTSLSHLILKPTLRLSVSSLLKFHHPLLLEVLTFPPTKCGKWGSPMHCDWDRPFQAVGDWFCSRALLRQCFLYTCLFETFIPDWVQWSFYYFLINFRQFVHMMLFHSSPSSSPSHLQSNKQADAIPGWLYFCSCKKMLSHVDAFFFDGLKAPLLIKVDWCLLLGSRLLFCSVYLLDMKMYKISLETQSAGMVRCLAV